MIDRERENQEELRTRISLRLSLVEGMLAAYERRTDVLSLVAESRDRAEAEQGIAALLNLSASEAAGILDLRLVRFTVEDIEMLRRERSDLRECLA